MKRIKKIVIVSVLLAANIILGRFLSIRTPILTIGFSFVPLMLTAIILGYKYSVLVGILSDLIVALLFPTGPYFVGYTISNALTGLVYGLLLYQKDFKLNKKFILKLIIAVLIVNFLINGILNTYFIMITTKNAVKIFAHIRFLKQAIMIPIKVITMLIICKQFGKKIRELQND